MLALMTQYSESRLLHAMQKVDHTKSPCDEGKYWVLSSRYMDLRRGSSMWEDAVITHFTQSEFSVIRVSTEVFQTMQSLPSDNDSASAGSGRKDGESHPRHLSASQRSASLPFAPLPPLVYTLPKCILLEKENLIYPADVAMSRFSLAM